MQIQLESNKKVRFWEIDSPGSTLARQKGFGSCSEGQLSTFSVRQGSPVASLCKACIEQIRKHSWNLLAYFAVVLAMPANRM